MECLFQLGFIVPTLGCSCYVHQNSGILIEYAQTKLVIFSLKPSFVFCVLV